MQNLLDQQLELWFSSMRKYDNTLWGYQDDSFIKQYRPWLTKYWEMMDSSHRVLLFCNDSKEEAALRGRIQNREIRIISERFALNSGIWICGDYMIMLMTQQQPHYAVQIHDPVFAENLRRIMQHMWALTSDSE